MKWNLMVQTNAQLPSKQSSFCRFDISKSRISQSNQSLVLNSCEKVKNKANSKSKIKQQNKNADSQKILNQSVLKARDIPQSTEAQIFNKELEKLDRLDILKGNTKQILSKLISQFIKQSQQLILQINQQLKKNNLTHINQVLTPILTNCFLQILNSNPISLHAPQQKQKTGVLKFKKQKVDQKNGLNWKNQNKRQQNKEVIRKNDQNIKRHFESSRQYRDNESMISSKEGSLSISKLKNSCSQMNRILEKSTKPPKFNRTNKLLDSQDQSLDSSIDQMIGKGKRQKKRGYFSALKVKETLYDLNKVLHGN